jgi:hypothetical protein
MNLKSRAGIAPLLILLYIAGAAAVGLIVAKPKFLNGESKRADKSTKTTEALIETKDKRSAVAAASVVKIGEANAEAPPSPQKDFITREIPVALAGLPAADVEALLAAEARKRAVCEGQLLQADKLYGIALEHTKELEQKVVAATAAKRAADIELQTVAAANLATERQANRWILICCALGALYVYTKFTHIGIGAIHEACSDIRAGVPGVVALDNVTTRLQQKLVRLTARLKSHPYEQRNQPAPVPPAV